jgi:hypothetical protein
MSLTHPPPHVANARVHRHRLDEGAHDVAVGVIVDEIALIGFLGERIGAEVALTRPARVIEIFMYVADTDRRG